MKPEFKYRQMKASEILAHLEERAREERLIQGDVLKLLREVERRRLYADLGYGSTFEYCVKHLKYSEGSASRRISAMRLISDLPEPRAVEQSLEEGRLSITALGQAQRFFRDERLTRDRVHTPAQKSEVVNQLMNLNGGERDRLFAKLAPDALPSERMRELDGEHSVLRVVLDRALVKKLDRIRSLWSHRLEGKEYAELLDRMADFVLERVDPERKIKSEQKVRQATSEANATSTRGAALAEMGQIQVTSSPSLSPTMPQSFAAAAKLSVKTPSRYIPAPLRRAVLQRDGFQCSYNESATGRRCDSRHRLELDHIQPYARGGARSLSNLRTVCRAHNLRAAYKTFGELKMNHHVGKTPLRK